MTPQSPTRLTTKAFMPARGLLVVLVPEADEQVAAEADALPAEEHDDEVVPEDEEQHREDEEVQVREEAPVGRLRLHVGARVDVDERADARDDERHQAPRAGPSRTRSSRRGSRSAPSATRASRGSGGRARAPRARRSSTTTSANASSIAPTATAETPKLPMWSRLREVLPGVALLQPRDRRSRWSPRRGKGGAGSTRAASRTTRRALPGRRARTSLCALRGGGGVARGFGGEPRGPRRGHRDPRRISTT